MWDKLKEQFNLLKLEKRKLYLITNSDKFLSKELFIDAIASALQGGVDVIQLNETGIPDNVYVDIGRKVRMLCDEFGATFIINNRCDIAQVVEADGVHLDESSISIDDAREIFGQNAIIGYSIYSPEGAVSAFNEGADYISISYENTNIDDIQWINDNIDIPLFVTGEFTPDNISSAIQSGIRRVGTTNSIMYAQIPEKTAREFLRFLP